MGGGDDAAPPLPARPGSKSTRKPPPSPIALPAVNGRVSLLLVVVCPIDNWAVSFSYILMSYCLSYR